MLQNERYQPLPPIIRKLLVLARNTMTLAPSDETKVQLVRSVAVSVVALIADFGGLIILKEKLGIQYLLAAPEFFRIGFKEMLVKPLAETCGYP